MSPAPKGGLTPMSRRVMNLAHLVTQNARRYGDRVGFVWGDRSWTWRQVVSESRQRADLALALRHEGSVHVGVLLDNVPEFVFWMGGAALAGAVMVGANPTHRGDELARDLSHTECQLLVTNSGYRPLVEGHDLRR